MNDETKTEATEPGTDMAISDGHSRNIAQTDPLGSVGALLDAMMKLARDPEVDAQKFETIARVAKDARDDAKKEQYYQDKAAAMFAMPVIRKDKRIVIPGKGDAPDRVQGTFASWPDLQRAIDPILHANNLRLSHEIGHDGVVVLVRPILQHRNGYVERGDQMALPLDQSGGKNNTQGAGSATTYGQRYTTVPFLGIRYEGAQDDDGSLTAMPDEPMNDQQQRRLEEAERAAGRGREAYENWFKSIPPIDRAWMIQTGRHNDYRDEAGPLPEGNAQIEAQPKGEAKPKANGKAQTTPKEWAEGYIAKIGQIESLTDLAMLQDKERRTLDALKGRDKTLHDKCVKAGNDAFERLRGDDDDSEPGDDAGLFDGETN
ncbi:MAG: putative recombinase [Prokaryotic dsDNA virus sp.]|nr:hypothetical protein [Pseudomonas sp.]MBS67361.1 hypothetical protein [Pseudomonas sp.]QDP55226.1 MAG: putative recombinase [Prokaryotic dsDNA virus sp.]|tara:strand:- start:1676 stop:2797 length:1122 start_codon:yes stop_codon:yes gene_type:complete